MSKSVTDRALPGVHSLARNAFLCNRVATREKSVALATRVGRSVFLLTQNIDRVLGRRVPGSSDSASHSRAAESGMTLVPRELSAVLEES